MYGLEALINTYHALNTQLVHETFNHAYDIMPTSFYTIIQNWLVKRSAYNPTYESPKELPFRSGIFFRDLHHHMFPIEFNTCIWWILSYSKTLGI